MISLVNIPDKNIQSCVNYIEQVKITEMLLLIDFGVAFNSISWKNMLKKYAKYLF